MKKILLGFVITLFFLLYPSGAFAKGEFTADYSVFYDVSTTGITTVTENINLTNQTDRYYPSSFTLTIGATKITDVEASDSSGALPVEVQNLGKKAQIQVKFSNMQVVGLGKKYNFKLKFNSSDFAQAQGKIWQVSVPKISSSEEIDGYNLTLAVPVSFGDPTTILPEPSRQFESGGKLNFLFTKEKLIETGILANFGSNQLFDYSLEYHLDNNSVLPALAKLSVPTTNEYQEVIVNSLDPKPQSIVMDEDGNAVAYYELDRKESKTVKAMGIVKLYLKPNLKSKPLSDGQKKIYTSQAKNWDKDSPQIKEKLKEIFKDGIPPETQEKARLINKFVVDYLTYDEARLKNADFQRLGSLTALSNPSQALCTEFTDLFIALSRAAGIPARQLIGYAYTSNQDIRPTSLEGTIFHTWPEYYDDAQGWIMIDPTWQSTTGGVDYFSRFDLNHFVLTRRGVSSSDPISPDKADVKFYDGQFEPKESISISMDSPSEVYAGFPASMKVKISNSGNTVFPATPFSLSSSNISFGDKVSPNSTAKSYELKPIPAFGELEFEFNLLTGPLWRSFEDILIAKAGEVQIERKILIKPFFAYKIFSYSIVGFLVIIVGVYAFVLTHHIKTKGPHISQTGGLKKRDDT